MYSLISLYSWLNQHADLHDVDVSPITSEDISALEEHISAHHLKNPDAAESEHAMFIEHCRDKQARQPNPYSLTLSYLMLPDHIEQSQDRICELFAAFWKKDKTQAYQFYEKHIGQTGNIALLTAIQKTLIKLCLPDVREALNEESDLLGIVLAWQDADDLSFIGLLLILLEKKIPPKKIIESGALHHRFKHRLSTLSELHQLYNVLKAFPEATELTDEIAKISAHSHGDKQTEAFAAYSLDGYVKKELAVSRMAPISFHFTETEQNFTKLYALFGFDFLNQTLLYITKGKHPTARQLFKTWIDQAAPEQIKELIRMLREPDSEASLEEVSKLISDEQIDHLVNKQDGSILYLAPFRPNLLSRLSHEKVDNFIANIIKANDPFESIRQLTAMLQGLDESRIALKEKIFRSVIDIFLKNTQLEDDVIFATLSPYTLTENNREWLQELADAIAARLDETIETYSPYLLAGDDEEGKAAYRSIKNTWSDDLSKVELLQRLAPTINLPFPPDEYALICMLVTNFLKKGQHIAIDSFLARIFPRPDKTQAGVGDFERALIELLLRIDNATLRNTIIDHIAGDPCNRPDWMANAYYRGLIHEAADRINPGFLSYLIEQKLDFIDTEYLNALLKNAAAEGNVSIVSYFLALEGDNEPSQDLVSRCLQIAGENNRVSVMKLFLELSRDNKLAPRDIQIAFLHSSSYRQWDSVKYLLGLTGENKLSTSAVSNALNGAAKDGRVDVLERIFAHQGEEPLSIDEVSEALRHAAIGGSLAAAHYLFTKKEYQFTNEDVRIALSGVSSRDVLQYLIKQDDIKVTQEDITIAITWAVEDKCWQAVAYLVTFEGSAKLSRETVTPLLIQIAAAGDLDTFQLIVTHAEYPPSREEIDGALIAAAGKHRWNLVNHLINQTGEESPTSHGIDQALEHATHNDQWGIAQTILNMNGDNAPTQSAVEKAFGKAANNGLLDMLGVILELGPEKRPTKEQINQHCSDAAYFTDTSVLHYFLQLDEAIRPDRRGMNNALATAARLADLNIVKYLMEELGEDDRPDEEGVIEALKCACTNTNVLKKRETLDYLLAYAKKHHVGNLAIADALSVAAHNNMYTLEQLLALEGEHSLALGNVLSLAVAYNQVSALRFLLALDGKSRPGQEAIDAALDSLMGILDNGFQQETVMLTVLLQGRIKPSSNAIGRAFTLAAAKCDITSGESYIVAHFLALTDLTSTQCGDALVSAAASNNITNLTTILQHKGENRPNQEKVVAALDVAMSRQDWSIVNKLIRLSDKKNFSKAKIEQILQQAVETYILELSYEQHFGCNPLLITIITLKKENAPSIGAIKEALTQLNANGRSELVSKILQRARWSKGLEHLLGIDLSQEAAAPPPPQQSSRIASIDRTNKSAIIEFLTQQLANPNLKRTDILDLFLLLKDRNGPFNKVHEGKNPTFDSFRLFFKKIRNNEDFWHTETYQTAVKMLKDAYLHRENDTSVSGSNRTDEEKAFIDYVIGNKPLHVGDTATRKEFNRRGIKP